MRGETINNLAFILALSDLSGKDVSFATLESPEMDWLNRLRTATNIHRVTRFSEMYMLSTKFAFNNTNCSTELPRTFRSFTYLHM